MRSGHERNGDGECGRWNLRETGGAKKEGRSLRRKELDQLHQPERDERHPVLQWARQVHLLVTRPR